MMWIQQKLKKWLGIPEMELEIDRLHQMVSSLELILDQKQDQMDSPDKVDDTRDILMEDTPDAHLGAF